MKFNLNNIQLDDIQNEIMCEKFFILVKMYEVNTKGVSFIVTSFKVTIFIVFPKIFKPISSSPIKQDQPLTSNYHKP